MKNKKTFLKCSRCGSIDKTDKAKYHIGTLEIMRCRDCCTEQSNGYAQLCRKCCPSEHCTK